MLEEHQQATAVGTAPTLPTTQAYPSGHTTGLTIGQPQVTLPNPAHRGPWATTRERYQQQVPLPTTPCMTGVSVGVPSVAAPSGVASTHGAAFPAMAVPNPTTPLGAFPTQTPLRAGQPHTGDEYFKREKSPLPKLVIKSGDATTITRIVHEWLQKTTMALNTWSSSAIQLWHHAVGVVSDHGFAEPRAPKKPIRILEFFPSQFVFRNAMFRTASKSVRRDTSRPDPITPPSLHHRSRGEGVARGIAAQAAL